MTARIERLLNLAETTGGVPLEITEAIRELNSSAAVVIDDEDTVEEAKSDDESTESTASVTE